MDVPPEWVFVELMTNLLAFSWVLSELIVMLRAPDPEIAPEKVAFLSVRMAASKVELRMIPLLMTRARARFAAVACR
jgi:hypothetical protein